MVQVENNSASRPQALYAVQLSSTDNPRVSVQCEDDPEGQNGHIVIENISYGLPWLTADPDDEGVVSDICEEEDLILEDSHQNAERYEMHGESRALQVQVENSSASRPQALYAVQLSSTDTDNPRVSVQCEDDPEGQYGCVIFDSMSYHLPRLTTEPDDEGFVFDVLREEDLMVADSHQSSEHCGLRDLTAVQAQEENYSVNNPESRSAVDLFSTDTDNPPVSVQCEDDPEGRQGHIVFDNVSYSLHRLDGDADD